MAWNNQQNGNGGGPWGQKTGGGGKGSWGSGPDGGGEPPNVDVDEMVRNLQNRLGGVFGGAAETAKALVVLAVSVSGCLLFLVCCFG
ncbi:MAG: protease modulator HflK N-terminal domain-containing protein [Robiginitomaculum sp.]|nr:protease modulator HflK N-terminal domain-containing protein [Robiginitomaculum sp.]